MEASEKDREEVLKEVEVSRCFKQVSQRSACGPHEVLGAVLKHRHVSLAPVFTRVFQVPLDFGHIPTIRKSPNVIHVPNKPSPSVFNDHCLVALTSISFKCMERMVLQRLFEATRPLQDPLQFAYTRNRNTETIIHADTEDVILTVIRVDTEDAILTVIRAVLKHLEKPKAFA